MNMNNVVKVFQTIQKHSHCGPCSLSYCLGMYGLTVTQEEIARASGVSRLYTYLFGLDEVELSKAALHYGFELRPKMVTERARAREFMDALHPRLEEGRPAVLLTLDFSHWMALVGYLEDEQLYVIADPRTHELFITMTEDELTKIAWCRNSNRDDQDEPDQYYVLFVDSVADARPVLKITRTVINTSLRR